MGFYQLLTISVIFNVTANVLLKKGVVSFGGVSGEASKLIESLTKAALNPLILVGLVLYGLSFLIWLRVLSFNDLSKSYPIFAACVFLLTTAISLKVLNESISLNRIFGIVIMLVGIFIVARS